MGTRKEKEAGHRVNEILDRKRKALKEAGPKAREAAAGRRVNHLLEARRHLEKK